MTHVPEDEFAESVQTWLESEFGSDDVEQNYVLDETSREVDFLANGPVATWAIEVENDAESLIKGTGQTTLYAAHDPEYRPAVVVPAGHVEEPERTLVAEHLAVVEFDAEEGKPVNE
ncbi:hypothetical protein [Halospeciosus flavus]|uniref:Uncharacterized protein n=1 Tax=Halospeciosus flavus TaxID=3032283 RepID=A0ABD5Z2R8_9EURY|nr:hypothetical protein [Halospeciosus flavus]